MEEQALELDIDNRQPVAAKPWHDVALVALLLVSAVALRSWLMFNTEVLARDSIGYIRYALEFESDGWSTVLRNNHQHPGYPLTVLAMSVPVRAYATGSEAQLMSLSAQLASNLAAVLLVIPMYFLGKLLFHRAAGFGAAALFQCLPVPAHVLSDGLSEAQFLLFAVCTLWFAVWAMRGHRPWLFGLCGVFGGLAYLTRPEGALIVASALIVLVGLRVANVQRRTLGQLAACGGSMAVMAVVVAAPYIFATGSVSNKPSIHQMLHKEVPAVGTTVPQAWFGKGQARPLLASTLGITLNLQDAFGRRAWQAVWGLGGELAKCFHYFAWPPVLLGMWWFRRRPLAEPGMWVLLVFCGAFAVVLWWLAVHVGYMSDRHLLLLVVCGCYAGAAAVWEIPGRWTVWLMKWTADSGKWPVNAQRPPSAVPTMPYSLQSMGIASIMFCAMLAAGLPKTLEKLHANRAGHHAAGLWLADNSAAADVIEDDHCWAHYYAGRVFQERKPVTAPRGYVPVRYIVVGRRDRDINLTWNRAGPLSEDRLRAEGGRIVYHWPVQQNPDDAPIVIYSVAPPATAPVANPH